MYFSITLGKSKYSLEIGLHSKYNMGNGYFGFENEDSYYRTFGFWIFFISYTREKLK